MTYLYAPLIGLFITLLNILVPFIIPLLLPTVKWDKVPSTDRTGNTTIRGDLPNWLSWFSTPDERLPGGLYEEDQRNKLAKYGKWFTSWYWLGIRNALFGLAIAVGKPATSYIPDERGFYKSGDIWQYSIQLGPLRFVTGYKVYRLLNGEFWAAPCFTLMSRP